MLGRKQGKNLVFIAANMNVGPSGFSKFLNPTSITLFFFDEFSIEICLFSNFVFHFDVVDNAPVTRAIVIACTIFTIIFGVRGHGNQLGWSYQVVLLSGYLLVLVLF